MVFCFLKAQQGLAAVWFTGMVAALLGTVVRIHSETFSLSPTERRISNASTLFSKERHGISEIREVIERWTFSQNMAFFKTQQEIAAVWSTGMVAALIGTVVHPE